MRGGVVLRWISGFVDWWNGGSVDSSSGGLLDFMEGNGARGQAGGSGFADRETGGASPPVSRIGHWESASS